MEKVIWSEQYNIGVEIVDKAHAKLFRIVNKITDLLEDEQASRHACEEGIKYLESYTMKHFSEEEAYMRSINYRGYSHHKRIHDNFRDKTLVSLKHDLLLSRYSPRAVERFLKVIVQWLTEHILAEDQAIVGKSMIQQPYSSSSKTAIISKTVNHATQDIFQVEAKLVQSDYKGQNIGTAYYCRLIYDINNDKKVQLLLGLEEQFILKGNHHILKAPLSQKNIFMNSAALHVFQQLSPYMGKMFRSETIRQLNKRNLMTKDEFRTEFMKGYPCNLLFTTRLGYLVFCYHAWRVKKHHLSEASAENNKTE